MSTTATTATTATTSPTAPTRRTFLGTLGALLAACSVPLGVRKAKARAMTPNDLHPLEPGQWLIYNWPGVNMVSFACEPENEPEMWRCLAFHVGSRINEHGIDHYIEDGKAHPSPFVIERGKEFAGHTEPSARKRKDEADAIAAWRTLNPIKAMYAIEVLRSQATRPESHDEEGAKMLRLAANVLTAMRKWP